MALAARGLSAVLLLGALPACSAETASAGRALEVVTTISPITNLVENVGGEHVEITGLVPEGTDSHTFEPAPSDAQVLAEADVVFMNGLHLEEPTRALAEANVREDVEVVELGDRVIDPDEYIYDPTFPEANGDPNPHLWTNPIYARAYARIIRGELMQLDPDNAGSYRNNFGASAAKISALDDAVRTVTATLPPPRRKLLTYHDSFPYFAREYGWEIVGAIQPSDLSDPTASEVADLIRQIEEERVPAIFGSEVFPSPILEQIAAETGASYVDDLRDDDLPGEPGDPNHSYVGLMVFDFRTFMGALGADVSALDAVDTSNIEGAGTAEYR